MSYHPIMGILLFAAFIVLAFMLGKKNIQKSKKNILTLKKRKNIEMESIAPDANWID